MIAVIAVVVIVIAAIAGYMMLSRPSSTPQTPTNSGSGGSSSNGTTTSTSSTSSGGNTGNATTLNIIAWSGICGDYITEAGKLFEQQHPGVKVNVYTYPFSQYISVELTYLKAHSSQFDIMSYTPTSSALIAPYLVPLNLTQDFNTSDLIMPQETYAGIVYNYTTHQNITAGIAYATCVDTLVYNTTIFDNKTLQNEFYNEYHMNFSPQTWQNWTVVIDVDQFLTSHHVTKYGILLPDDTSHNIWNSYLVIFGYYYARNSSLNDGLISGLPEFQVYFQGKILPGYNFPLPSINSTAGVQALEVYKQLVSYMIPPSQVQITYDNIINYLPQSPGMISWPGPLGGLNQSQLEQLAYAPLPGGYAVAGSDFVGISKYSQHQQLALEFLQFLVSPQVQAKLFYMYEIFPISKEAYNILLSNTSLPSYERQWLTVMPTIAEEGWDVGPIIPPTYEQLLPTFNNEVLLYLEGQVNNPQQVLNTIASQWMQYLKSYYG
ncbi:carbohydrate ABC transporter substrate-binding protein, CUT1 family [Metallosphaera sedula]|uniref:Carbohydrate ABC transporter substrate-binding protein, CUT1 family n=4 Tax=Metallosphaera TaxID=41980 RepID=A4YFZ0_METS5|nr:carbohydrate ABC transporter substrate-binding protein, CUT1 family [Metallosphaera sedula DSM 5348]AIM27328.1 carbohydrate ABC transporter substrate-binding protein, CUT1 family [Metallosphaera sedula]